MTDAKRGKIIVVDDDPRVLDVTTILLRESGYLVAPFPRAADGLAELKSAGADAVISDIVMPEMTGIELLRQIKDFAPDLPVLLMTGFTDIENAVAAIKIGAFDFLLKPYTPEQLLHAVAKAFRFKRLLETEQDYKRVLGEFNQELETLIAERTMSLMAMTLADRIRNPASVIGLTSRKLIQRPDTPEDLKPALQAMLDEALKLDRLVQDFQCILTSKQSKFVYEDLNALVRTLLEILGPELVEKGIWMDVKLSSEPIRMNMQKDLLRMALLNLLRNAIEATPRNGTVSVSSSATADRAALVIADTGPGVPQDLLEKIFDPLFSTKEHRFGMGLPLAKQVFTEHMAELTVRSEPGTGTAFTISFPLRWSGTCSLPPEPRNT
ncbi:MAG: response regulator [Thermodesulfovibrionales bacterium]